MAEHIFDSVADASSDSNPIPVGDVVRVLGWDSAGDGGAAYWLRVASEPSHEAKY